MARRPKASGLPLSPDQLVSTRLKVPRHKAEAPPAPAEIPRFTLHRVAKPARARSAGAQVAPSMPSYETEMRARPAPMVMSPPPHVMFRGHELDPYIIFQPEGRAAYNDTTFPWRCVCRVTSGTKGGCGALVGPRHVLTASHVVDWNALTASVAFVQGGVTLAASVVTNGFAYTQVDDVTYNNADDDYAVLVLAARVGITFGWFGFRTYDAAWDNETTNWCNIAYAPDFAMSSSAIFQTGFFLDEDDFDLGGGRMLITKTGDFVRGMSGSPVFGFWPPGPFIVGVASGGASGLGDYNAIAGGSDLTSLILDARAALP